MDDGSASIFCFTPTRVTVSELDRLRATPPPPESSPGPVCSAPSIPHGPCPVCPRLEQEFEPWRQAAYWQSMHRRALEREARLQAEVEPASGAAPPPRAATLRPKDRGRRRDRTDGPAGEPRRAALRRNRGQQRGRTGPKRRDHSHLPAVVEDHELPPEQCRCSRCGQPFADFPGTEDAIILEVDVRAIVGSSDAAALGRPAPVPPIPASSSPRRRPG